MQALAFICWSGIFVSYILLLYILWNLVICGEVQVNKKWLKKCIILIILTSYYMTCSRNFFSFGMLMVIWVKFELLTMKGGLWKPLFQAWVFQALLFQHDAWKCKTFKMQWIQITVDCTCYWSTCNVVSRESLCFGFCLFWSFGIQWTAPYTRSASVVFTRKFPNRP